MRLKNKKNAERLKINSKGDCSGLEKVLPVLRKGISPKIKREV